MTYDEALQLVRDEVHKARSKHRKFASAHEGYAVLLEEVEELWDDIKADKHKSPDTAHEPLKEAIQVGAMVVAMIAEVLGDRKDLEAV